MKKIIVLAFIIICMSGCEMDTGTVSSKVEFPQSDSGPEPEDMDVVTIDPLDTGSSGSSQGSGSSGSGGSSSGNGTGSDDQPLILETLFGNPPEFFVVARDGFNSSDFISDGVSLISNDLIISLNNQRTGKFNIEIDFELGSELEMCKTIHFDLINESGKKLGSFKLKVNKNGTVKVKGKLHIKNTGERIILSCAKIK